MNLIIRIFMCVLLTASAFGQLATRNPLDELRDQVIKVLADAGVPFTPEQEKQLALLIEEERQATEDLFGEIMDFRGGPPQGQQRDRALAGIQWMHDEFKKKLPNYLTDVQRAAWEKFEANGSGLGARIEGAGTRGARVEQIQQIRINNNPFSAEDPFYGGFGVQGGGGNFERSGGNFQAGNFQGGGANSPFGGGGGGGGNFQFGGNRGNQRTEIIQRGGTGAFHGNINAIFQDEALNARNPYANNKPPYHERTINGNFNGPLIQDRLSINFGINDNRQENVGTVQAITLDGPFSLGVTRPNVNRNFNGRAILQLSRTQSIHFGGRYFRGNRKNQNVGNFSLPERGVHIENGNHNIELRQISVLSPRAVYETRFGLEKNRFDVTPISNSLAIIVLDAFTGGGAQERRQNRGKLYDFGNLFYYTGEKTTLRTGMDGRYRSRRSLQESNFAGEFTFSDLESYRIGRPLKYRVTRGDPLLHLSQLEMAFFVQEDIRLTNTFTLMLGARYEAQTNLSDKNNIDPRLGLAYAVGSSTVIRGGLGLFHQRVQDQVIQDLMRLDGTRQYEILIDDPSWPNPFLSGSARFVPPPSRRVHDASLVAPYNVVTSVSFERTLPANLFLTISGEYNRGIRQLRSRNLNAPVPGTSQKPFPDEGHIYQLESTGKSTYKNVRFSMRQRLSIFNVMATYTLASGFSDTDGPFYLPANNYDLRSEWGRAGSIARHSFNTGINARLPLDVYLTTNITANSGDPYNITTGKDDNGDGQTNDRPAGVMRNSADGPRFFNVGFNFNKAFRLGGTSSGSLGLGRGADAGVGPQLSVFLNLNNALNMTNPGTPSGVMTSPFFGKSFSAASGPREIEAGLRFQF